MNFSIADIKAQLDILQTAQKYMEVKKQGREYIAVCPFHADHKASLTISPTKQFYKCFACGAQGDAIDLICHFEGKTEKDIVREWNSGGVQYKAKKRVSAPVEKEEEKNQIIPIPADKLPPPPVKVAKNLPDNTYTYKTADGGVIGYIHRFNLTDGKTIIPQKFTKNGWENKAFDTPRPLYGLDRLAAAPGAPVVIVEGEKCADVAASIFDEQGLICITWVGGANSVKKIDWNPLKGRRVCIWPDADAQKYPDGHEFAGQLKPLNEQPGTAAALEIAAALKDIAEYVKILKLPAPGEKPSGWDIADAVQYDKWDAPALSEFIQKLAVSPEEILNPSQSSAHEAEPSQQEEEPEQRQEEARPEENTAAILPFRLLGHNDGIYYYLPNGGKQLVALAASEHKQLQLFRLAPFNWWSAEYPNQRNNGIDWAYAANSLIEAQHKIGIFTPKKLRGRGCWIDEKRVVFHAGDRLFVDGEPTAIEGFKSKFIYEKAEDLNIDDITTTRPMTSAEAAKLLRLCEMLPLTRPIQAKFLAGWVVIAPICGVLQWRPHIWLNGPSGSGKTWVLKNIVMHLLAKISLKVQSSSTEAGIRQYLKSDALPVIFDEAESEDKSGMTRMQKLLELVRQSSSENDAGIIKGTAGGRAMEYLIRSMFCFSSIGVGAVQRADISRFTFIELTKKSSNFGVAKFETLKQFWAETLNQPNFASELRARTLKNACIIAKNAEIFGRYIAEELGDARAGDQYGPLCAGAFSLTSQKIITEAAAKQWVKDQDWETFKLTDSDNDEIKCLSKLLEGLIKYETTTGNFTKSVFELIKLANLEMSPEGDAHLTLERHGIKVSWRGIDISDCHTWIELLYENTQWAKKWRHQFLRLDGAQALQAASFNGLKQRFVRLPLDTLLYTAEAEKNDQNQKLSNDDIPV